MNALPEGLIPADRFATKRSGIKMDIYPRCEMGCGKNGRGQVLGIRLTRPWAVYCRKCKHVNWRD
jgi:hypothetical protein